MSKPTCAQKQKVRLASQGILAFNRRVNVFTYGSLMFDEVWNAVTGRLHPSLEGVLSDHEAWQIAGQTFPGMTPAPGHRVRGRVWREVESRELAQLDEFESGIYDRLEVQVQLSDGAVIPCWTYVVRQEHRGMLLEKVWDREEFRRLHLARFLDD